MLPLRLHRAGIELQSHRLWLKTFVNGSQHNTWSFDVPVATCFSTSRGYGQGHGHIHGEQKPAKARQIVGKSPRTAWQKREKHKADGQLTVQLSALSVREDLLQAVQEEDIKTAIALYHTLPGKKPLTPEDFRAIAQCTHQHVRLENQKLARSRDREDKEELVNFALRLVEDLEHGNLLPDLPSHIHLLAIFRESGRGDAGTRFWQWLEGQDDDYVSTGVYAAAIDLLAVNGSPLSELEDLYQNALSRFPGNFHAYHLSPDAILPDREQPLEIGQLPLWLFKAILQARLLRGDAQKAYLALDTVFRLFPTSVPPRVLTAFTNERPITEAYTIYAMACRAGIQLPASHYKGLLAKLRTSSDMATLPSHIASLRAMLAANYLYLGTNGTIPANSVNETIIATTQILRLPGISALDPKQRRRVVDTVLEAVRRMLECFARYGVLPAVSIFNSIITNIAGYGRAKETIGIALADMDALSLRPNEITRRSIITAAGLLGDEDLVQKTWKDIVDISANEGKAPDGLDFHVLIKAARLIGIIEFAEMEYGKFKEQVHFKHHRSIDEMFQKPLDEMNPTWERTSLSADEVGDSLQSLLADLAFIEEKTKDRPVPQDFSNQHLPMTLLRPEEQLQIPDREMRKIYDEMTTEKDSPPTSTPADPKSTNDVVTPPTSDTGISLGNLRYENWKTLNYLLQLSEKHDREYEKAVDEAIASGVRPPTRNMGISKAEVEGMRSFGLSSASVSSRKAVSQDVEEARKEVRRLRMSR